MYFTAFLGDLMGTKSLSFTLELQQYIEMFGVREHPVLRELREFTQSIPGGEMQISPVQGQFMGFLVGLIQAKAILEIGTFTGYSSLSMALNLPENGKLITCDIDEKVTEIAQRFWVQAGIADKIELRIGKGLETLSELSQQQFDLIFIDADKRNFMAYYEACYLLLKPGGLMLLDNVLWGGKVTDSSNQTKQTIAIHELNQHVHADPRVDCSMIPVGDGLTLVRKI